MPTPLGFGIDVQTLKSLDDREIQALMAAVDVNSIHDSKVREHLEARLSASGANKELVPA